MFWIYEIECFVNYMYVLIQILMLSNINKKIIIKLSMTNSKNEKQIEINSL